MFSVHKWVVMCFRGKIITLGHLYLTCEVTNSNGCVYLGRFQQRRIILDCDRVQELFCPFWRKLQNELWRCQKCWRILWPSCHREKYTQVTNTLKMTALWRAFQTLAATTRRLKLCKGKAYAKSQIHHCHFRLSRAQLATQARSFYQTFQLFGFGERRFYEWSAYLI